MKITAATKREPRSHWISNAVDNSINHSLATSYHHTLSIGMGPLKKRMRLKGPEDNTAVEDSIATNNVELPTVSNLNTLVQRMVAQVEGSNDANAVSTSLEPLQKDLLTLKRWQRTLLDNIQQSETALQEKQRARAKHQQAVQAFQYERDHLERKIEISQTYATPNLEKLAIEDLQLPDDASAEQMQAAVQQFLGGANVLDPSQKQQIIALLHQELNRRGLLQRDVKLKQQELNKITAELKNKRQILDSLPDQLAVLERASKPMQKFFSHAASNNTTEDSLRMIGTERSTRLEHARSLPTPLYTLFQQLQQYVDQTTSPSLSSSLSASSSKTSGAGVSVGVVNAGDKNKASDPHQVLLQLPVIDVAAGNTSSGRNKRVTIHFYCFSSGDAPTGGATFITAAASGCGSTLNQDVLLDELFAKDSPAPLPVDSSAAAVPGRPYHWCNYLAGLHLVHPAAPAASTRVIMQELRRRIRANATLKHILQSLQRKTVPTPPIDNDVDDEDAKSTYGVKLVSCILDKGKSSTTKEIYTVTLRKGSANLCVQVEIHLPRYPSVPPVWSLNYTGGSNDADASLYDDQLALLERRVNFEALDRFVDTSKEESYDWVLVRQLREIMQQWESWLEDRSRDSGGSRTRKGRDRALLVTST